MTSVAVVCRSCGGADLGATFAVSVPERRHADLLIAHHELRAFALQRPAEEVRSQHSSPPSPTPPLAFARRRLTHRLPHNNGGRLAMKIIVVLDWL